MDSGIGGLTIWSAIRNALPDESFAYFSDGAYAPYGDKSPEFIAERSERVVEMLLDWNIKLCVVACNTATTNAIDHLRSRFNLPFVGVEPAIKPAARQSLRGKIGVLATAGTLSSPLYQETARRFASEVEVVTVVGAGLVEHMERKPWDDPDLLRLLDRYMEPFRKARIDILVLGCTHYPFLEKAIRELFPYEITILDSSDAVARRTKELLRADGLCRSEEEVPGIPGLVDGNEIRQWLMKKELQALVPAGERPVPGIFLSSGPVPTITRALNYLGVFADPF